MPSLVPPISPHRLMGAVCCALMLALAACGDEPPPPTASAPLPAPQPQLAPLGTIPPGAATTSPDQSAFDAAQPATPPGAVPNTVGAAEQAKDAPPDPLPEQAPAPVPSGSDGIDYPVTARFVPDHPTIIEVSIRDRQGVDSVELVAPDGAATAAYQLDRNAERVAGTDDSGLDMGVAVVGGSGGGVRTGIGIGIPLFGFSDPAPPRDEVLSRARIMLPDPTAYSADWKRYVIRIHLGGTGPSAREMKMAAPPPA